MRIESVNNRPVKVYPTSFGVNLNSQKLFFKEDDFYVQIKGYGHNSGWAGKIKETADKTVNFIREKCSFEDALKIVVKGVTEANQFSSDVEKRIHTGNLRVKREGWEQGPSWWTDLMTNYSNKRKCRYRIYSNRLDYTVTNPLKNPYNDISLTRPRHDRDIGKFLDHGDAKYIDNAFNHINKIYDNLYENYILKEAKEENLADINSSIAEIKWILAHATPWERGSDAISNTFIRSIYKAIGIKTYPLKRGISLDLEAYCTNLDEYKNKFASYFSKKPKIIN